MDTPNSSGKYVPLRQHILHINVLGPELTEELRWFRHSNAEGFTRLVKALAEGNTAIEGALLRRWGIR